ncbi:MAG: hemolysin III family protein [Chloroflexi bacterium]|nr:hemolysin III family protein [Chloroflexota bacterium]
MLPQRPLLRGWFHLYAAIAAIAGAVLLVLLANSPRAYVGAAIFGASLILLYTTSAAYHRITWSPRLRGIVRRLDHSMIFALIAGTYTPISLLVLNTAWWISVLSVVWGITAVGILLKVVLPGAPKWLSVTLYAIVGWLALVTLPQLLAWLTIGSLALLLLGGVLYTLGGVVYAAGKPNPYPRWFGYHEVFHVLVIAGSVLHYTLVAIYLL